MYSAGAASTPIPHIHRWSSASRWQARQESHGLDPAQRAWLREARLRKVPVARGRIAAVMAATLLLHLLAMLGASYNMRMHPIVATPVSQQRVIRVELIEKVPAPVPSPPVPQALPDMQVRAPQAPKARPVREKIVAKPPPVDEAPNPQATAAALFDRQGEVILPAGAVTTAEVEPGYQAGILNSRNKRAEPQSPIEYMPTRFEKDWVPEGEGVLQSAVRKTLVEGTVMKLPGGTRVKCVFSPLALAGGCGLAAPEQLSAPLHVDFKRNNLPSATSLIKPAPASSSAEPAKASSVKTSPAPEPLH